MSKEPISKRKESSTKRKTRQKEPELPPESKELWNSVIQLGKGVKSGTAGINVEGFLLQRDASLCPDDKHFLRQRLTQLKKYLADNKIELNRRNDFCLLRYLHARVFDIPHAARLATKYECWRESEEAGQYPKDIGSVRELINSGTMAIYKEDNCVHEGEDVCSGHYIVVVRPGRWKPGALSAAEALKAASLAVEPLSFDKNRTTTIVIMDMTGVGIQHLKALNTALLSRIVFFITECVPVHIHSVHLIHEPVLFIVMIKVLRRFMHEDLKRKVWFHGRGVGRLRNQMCRPLLPPELEGTARQIDWLAHMELEVIRRGFDLLGYEPNQKEETPALINET